MGDILIDIEESCLSMEYGRIGRFLLYPNEIQDEFVMEGQGVLDFLHKLDLYSPSTWMTVHFEFNPLKAPINKPTQLCVSLFESGPIFHRIDK